MGHETHHLPPSGTDTKKSGGSHTYTPTLLHLSTQWPCDNKWFVRTCCQNQMLTYYGKTEVCITSRTGTGECKMICQMNKESLCIPSEVFQLACLKRVSCVFMSICVFIGSPCPHSSGHSLLATCKNMVLILSNYGKVMSSNIMKAYRGSRGIALRILNLIIT